MTTTRDVRGPGKREKARSSSVVPSYPVEFVLRTLRDEATRPRTRGGVPTGGFWGFNSPSHEKKFLRQKFCCRIEIFIFRVSPPPWKKVLRTPPHTWRFVFESWRAVFYTWVNCGRVAHRWSKDCCCTHVGNARPDARESTTKRSRRRRTPAIRFVFLRDDNITSCVQTSPGGRDTTTQICTRKSESVHMLMPDKPTRPPLIIRWIFRAREQTFLENVLEDDERSNGGWSCCTPFDLIDFSVVAHIRITQTSYVDLLPFIYSFGLHDR